MTRQTLGQTTWPLTEKRVPTLRDEMRMEIMDKLKEQTVSPRVTLPSPHVAKLKLRGVIMPATT